MRMKDEQQELEAKGEALVVAIKQHLLERARLGMPKPKGILGLILDALTQRGEALAKGTEGRS